MITEKQPLFVRKYLQLLDSWHRRVTEKLWKDVPEHWLTHITSAILICLAVSASAHMRVWQYDQWSDDRDVYYIDDFPFKHYLIVDEPNKLGKYITDSLFVLALLYGGWP